MYRQWGSHYGVGSLVFTHFEDGFGLAVVLEHTGDYHHKSVRVRIDNGDNTPEGNDHIVADPNDVYFSYHMGPAVAHLSTAQVMSLAAGVDVPKLTLSVAVETILYMESPAFRGPYKS